MAALLTQMSMGPSAASVPAAKDASASPSDTSQVCAYTVTPLSRSPAAARSSFSGLVPQMDTFAPREPKSSAAASPMPALPPVIRTTLLSKRMFISIFNRLSSRVRVVFMKKPGTLR